MRPGHCAPEKAQMGESAHRSFGCFNEAGALCPGKGWNSSNQQYRLTGFNEAGALCPGKGCFSRMFLILPMTTLQ